MFSDNIPKNQKIRRERRLERFLERRLEPPSFFTFSGPGVAYSLLLAFIFSIESMITLLLSNHIPHVNNIGINKA